MPTSGVTHWPGTLREGVPWLLGVAPGLNLGEGGVWEALFPQTESPPPPPSPLQEVRSSARSPIQASPTQQALSAATPPGAFLTLMRPHPPAPPQEGGPTETHPGMPPHPEGPHAAAAPAQHETPRAPLLPPPSSPASSPAGGQPPPRRAPTPAGHASFGDASWGWRPLPGGRAARLRPALTSFLTVRSSLCRVSASAG